MTTNHNCKTRASERRASIDQPYRFLDSGLSNVYLAGIKYWVCEECGKQAAEIPALEQLMSVMAKSVVMKAALLNGEEIRFLRKRIGKKAADFAELINKTPEHFSKLENDQLPLPEETDKLIRLTYGMLSGDQKLLSDIAAKAEEWLRSISNRHEEPITFKKKAGVWKPLAKAMAA
jgi:putative zinc finger/helix-turn-helix YgiT family protein